MNIHSFIRFLRLIFLISIAFFFFKPKTKEFGPNKKNSYFSTQKLRKKKFEPKIEKATYKNNQFMDQLIQNGPNCAEANQSGLKWTHVE